MINCICSQQVNLFREVTFRNSKQTYKGIPIMASNMDTVGTFAMAAALSKVNILIYDKINMWYFELPFIY